jgi:hypothetical protein
MRTGDFTIPFAKLPWKMYDRVMGICGSPVWVTWVGIESQDQPDRVVDSTRV